MGMKSGSTGCDLERNESNKSTLNRSERQKASERPMVDGDELGDFQIQLRKGLMSSDGSQPEIRIGWVKGRAGVRGNEA